MKVHRGLSAPPAGCAVSCTRCGYIGKPKVTVTASAQLFDCPKCGKGLYVREV